jgi:phosphoenolpyruvate carboxylase
MSLKKYINEEVSKLHQQVILESELEKVNKELAVLNESENNEGKVYESNAYEAYKTDLEEVVKSLAEACNKLETATLRQESHMKTLPEVNSRMEEGKNHKQVILDIFKEVKRAKIAAERKLYEMR